MAHDSEKDLSPSSVKRAVRRNALERPLTVYPAALGVVGGLVAFAALPGPWALAAIVGGASVAAGNWLWQSVVKGQDNATEFVKRYLHELEERRLAALAELEQELDDIGDDGGLAQIRLFQQKYRNFVDVLNRKLNPAELTYNRFLTIAEQVFLAGLDNLERAALAQKSVSAIDIDYIEGELGRLSGTDEQTKRRREELQARAAIRDEQLEINKRLKLANEAALTQLDKVTAEIAGISTREGRAQVDLEAAMDEMKRLIQRADAYSKTTRR